MAIADVEAVRAITGQFPSASARGTDPSFVAEELMYAIVAQINRHPRSQQVAIGPSEVGTPCERKLGYKLLNWPEVNPRVAWKAWIGTNVHVGLAEALAAENADTGSERYLMENTLFCGMVNGRPLFGHFDVYDRLTCGVIDWKVVGETQLKLYRKNGPGQQYRTQGHLYGRGHVLKGHVVDWVGIYFLPRAGELKDAYFWHEPYDESVALEGIERVEAIEQWVSSTMVDNPGSALKALPTADNYCTLCPYYKHAAKSMTDGCPGDPGAFKRKPSEPVLTFGTGK